MKCIIYRCGKFSRMGYLHKIVCMRKQPLWLFLILIKNIQPFRSWYLFIFIFKFSRVMSFYFIFRNNFNFLWCHCLTFFLNNVNGCFLNNKLNNLKIPDLTWHFTVSSSIPLTNSLCQISSMTVYLIKTIANKN